MNKLQTIDVMGNFEPRHYQQKFYQAFKNGQQRRFILIGPRRMGKDVLSWNCILIGAMKRVGTYLYILPTYESARGIIWNCILSNGIKMVDFIDPKLIAKKNEQLMQITLINGSQIKLCGSDNYNNSIVGRTASGMVFSEFALQDPMAWEYASAILGESDGWALFVSTVRGKNHLFDLYEAALNDPKDWYVEKLTYDDTQHMSKENWERELKTHSWDYIQQDYYCNFNLGIEGTIYGKYIDKLKINGQIATVPFQSRYRVNTAWDIGNDCTSIIFWQVCGPNINVIDYYEQSNKNLEFFVNFVESKARDNDWMYNKHFFPHDMEIRDWGSLGPRFSRIFKVQQMGLKGCIVVPKVSHEDGIELVRSELSRCFFDEKKCAQLIKCLENYRLGFDSEKRVYTRVPVHNWASHGSSAMKYLCLGIPQAGVETTKEELKERYQRVMSRGGGITSIGDIYRDQR